MNPRPRKDFAHFAVVVAAASLLAAGSASAQGTNIQSQTNRPGSAEQPQPEAEPKRDDVNPTWVSPLDVIANFFQPLMPGAVPVGKGDPCSVTSAADDERIKRIKDVVPNDVAIETMIVLVPDPIDARTAGEFDEALSALQKAAGDEGWLLDRHYLPWTETKQKENEQTGSQRLKFSPIQGGSARLGGYVISDINASGQAARAAQPVELNLCGSLVRVHENVPGVVLFRKRLVCGSDPAGPPVGWVGPGPVEEACWRSFPYDRQPQTHDKLLVAFLVGETQTWGVQRKPFRKVVEWAPRLDSGKQTVSDGAIRILGPWFSGSIDSLKAERNKAPSKKGTSKSAAGQSKRPWHLVTGTASASSVATAIDDPGVDLRQIVLNDKQLSTAAIQLLKDIGYERSQIAFVVESDSRYGQAFAAGLDEKPPITKDRTMTIPVYGRLSGVRSEWTTVKGVDVEPIEERVRDLRRLSRLALEDRGNPSDVVPQVASFSNAVVGMVLEQIVEQLKNNRIRHVGIVMTDIRDRIYLAEVLHRQMPDLTFSFFDLHALYAHPDLESALNGALTFSSFPLGWDLGPLRQEFSSDTAVGAYRGARLLLGSDAPCPNPIARVVFDGAFLDTGTGYPRDRPRPWWLRPRWRLYAIMVVAALFVVYEMIILSWHARRGSALRMSFAPPSSRFGRVKAVVALVFPEGMAALLAIALILLSGHRDFKIITPADPHVSPLLRIFLIAALTMSVWSFLTFWNRWRALHRFLQGLHVDESAFVRYRRWDWNPISALGVFNAGLSGFDNEPTSIFGNVVHWFDDLRVLLRTSFALVVLLIIGTDAYPFSPAHSAFLVLAVVAVSMVLWSLVFIRQMMRAPVLRSIEGSGETQANWKDVLLRGVEYAAAPLAALIATHAPRMAVAVNSVAEFLSRMTK